MTLTNWHASGLRWIGSLFTDAAEVIERREKAVQTLEPGADSRPAEDLIDEMRQRIRLRGF